MAFGASKRGNLKERRFEKQDRRRIIVILREKFLTHRDTKVFKHTGFGKNFDLGRNVALLLFCLFLCRKKSRAIMVTGGRSSGFVRSAVTDNFSYGYKIGIVRDAVFGHREVS
jgi:hypothetical protein